MPNEPPTLPVSTRIFSAGTPSDAAQQAAHAEHALAAEAQDAAAVSVSYSPIAERGSIGADDDRGCCAVASFVTCAARGEGGSDLLRVAVMEVEDHVAGHVVVELRRAGAAARARVGDGGQRIDVDEHRLGRVLRLLARSRRPRWRPDRRHSARCRWPAASAAAGAWASRRGSCPHAAGMLPMPAACRSAPVSAPSTPGMPAASDVRPSEMPCATRLRTMTA